MKINNLLFVIAQHMLSAIILILSFKHQIELLLFICILVTAAMGMIAINEFGYDKPMINCSFIGLAFSFIISQGYLEIKIINHFNLISMMIFIINIIPIATYLYYCVEKKE